MLSARGPGVVRWLVTTAPGLTLVSLLVHLAGWFLWGRGLAPRYDEVEYFERSKALATLLRAWLSGSIVEPTLWLDFYGLGEWPPANQAAQALMQVVFGIGRDVARLAPTLAASVTTGVVYLVTRRVATPAAAVVAAWMHVLHPTFLAYAHYLWSETLFVLFILLLALVWLRWREQPESLVRAAWVGFVLGLAALTRVTALPLMVAVPAWSLVRHRQWRGAAVVVLLAVLTIAPWQRALMQRERGPVLLSSAAWSNIWIANHDGVPDGLGSSWSHAESRDPALGHIVQLAQDRSVSKDAVARELSIRTIAKSPAKFLRRCGLRVGTLLSSNFFTLRHFVVVAYPPTSGAVVVGVWFLQLLAHVALFALAVWGTWVGGVRERGTLWSVVFFLAVPGLVSISFSRLNVPMQAILLPMAAWGALHLRRPTSRPRKRVLGGVAAALLVLSVLTLRTVVRVYLAPSSAHAGWLEPVSRGLNVDLRYVDRFELRAVNPHVPPQVEVTVETVGFGFAEGRGVDRQPWQVPKRVRTPTTFDVLAQDPAGPLVVGLALRGRPQSGGQIELCRPERWRRWTDTPLQGVQIRWMGAQTRPPVDIPLRLRSQP